MRSRSASRAPGGGARRRPWPDLLPRTSDWRREDGWLPAGIAMAATGTTGALLEAWRRLSPTTLPIPDRWIAAAAALALLSVAFGMATALRGEDAERAAWRWITIALCAAGGVACDPSGMQARFAFPCVIAAGVLALSLRAGETLVASLAAPLHALAVAAPLSPRHASPASGAVLAWRQRIDESLDVTLDQSPLWTTWRIVAEFWALTAASGVAAGIRGGASASWIASVGFSAAGGVVLVIGASLATLQASWRGRGFAVDNSHARAFWGLAGVAGGVLVILAASLPMPRGPFSPGVIGAALHALSKTHLPLTAAASEGLGPDARAGSMVGGVLTVPAAIVAWLTRDMWTYFGLWLLTPAALPFVLPVMAVSFVAIVRALRAPGGWRGFVARALDAVVTSLSFWRWIRLPRRATSALRRLLRAKGTRAGDDDEGVADVVALSDRLWAWVDPRSAVRKTYRRFLSTMERQGLARGPGQSPRAFERMVRSRALAREGVQELTAVYELARYSDHPAHRGWADRARQGLAFAVRRLRGRRVRGRVGRTQRARPAEPDT